MLTGGDIRSTTIRIIGCTRAEPTAGCNSTPPEPSTAVRLPCITPVTYGLLSLNASCTSRDCFVYECIQGDRLRKHRAVGSLPVYHLFNVLNNFLKSLLLRWPWWRLEGHIVRKTFVVPEPWNMLRGFILFGLLILFVGVTGEIK